MDILPHLCYDNSGDNVKAVGIICEYNPFHNGHLYHIKKIKEKINTLEGNKIKNEKNRK